MSDELSALKVVRDLGMVIIPGLTALGGVLLAHILEGRRKRREVDEQKRLELWHEYRPKIIEVKNYAAGLYERRTSKQFDQLRKPFMRDLESLNDLAGYWHAYDPLRLAVSRYISTLRDLYGQKELNEVDFDMLGHYHSDVDEACTQIIDRGHPPSNPWKSTTVSKKKRRAMT